MFYSRIASIYPPRPASCFQLVYRLSFFRIWHFCRYYRNSDVRDTSPIFRIFLSPSFTFFLFNFAVSWLSPLNPPLYVAVFYGTGKTVVTSDLWRVMSASAILLSFPRALTPHCIETYQPILSGGRDAPKRRGFNTRTSERIHYMLTVLTLLQGRQKCVCWLLLLSLLLTFETSGRFSKAAWIPCHRWSSHQILILYH
jgi:hypothetical protein